MKTTSFWLKNALSRLLALVGNERRIGVEILEIISEIESRKAYAELGYDGIYTFCVKELKFTESQAFQRIQAMRALRNAPELKEKIKDGRLSVSTVSQVQVFLRQEAVHGIKRTVEEKQSLFAQAENKTSKEVKAVIQELKGERVKTRLILELDDETDQLWKEFKAASAHQSLGDDLKGFKLLLNSWLSGKKAVISRRAVSGLTGSKVKNSTHIQNDTHDQHSKPNRQTIRSRHIPNSLRRQVFKRDEHKCTQCGSTHALTLEHIIPFASGGIHTADNLKVLCRSCNLHQGILSFGVEKMRRSDFLN